MAKVCLGLKAVREERLLTQMELAKKAGLNHTTIVMAEKGQGVALATVRALCSALRVKPEKLLSEA